MVECAALARGPSSAPSRAACGRAGCRAGAPSGRRPAAAGERCGSCRRSAAGSSARNRGPSSRAGCRDSPARRSRRGAAGRCPRRGPRRSRSCASAVPSPYTVTSSPRSACMMKFGTTRPSSVRMRGPNVLKMRTMRVSTPVRAVVRHGHRLGEALGFVVDAARADRIDVAPVFLVLRVDERIAVDLGGRGEQEAGALLLRQAERLVRAERAHLEGLDRQLEVVDRAGRRGEVQDRVERALRRRCTASRPGG